jgi:hypothetical protein
MIFAFAAAAMVDSLRWQSATNARTGAVHQRSIEFTSNG